jgi:predicted nucleic acid-binding protein
LIDSSFVVALVNPKDENHEKALKLSVEFDRRPMLITDVILLEIGNALARGFKIESIDAIEGFLASKRSRSYQT